MTAARSQAKWAELVKFIEASPIDRAGIYRWNAENCFQRDDNGEEAWPVFVRDTANPSAAFAVRHVYIGGNNAPALVVHEVYDLPDNEPLMDPGQEMLTTRKDILSFEAITENPPRIQAELFPWQPTLRAGDLILIKSDVREDPRGYHGSQYLSPPSYTLLGRLRKEDATAETITIDTFSRFGYLMPPGSVDVVRLDAGDNVHTVNSPRGIDHIRAEVEKLESRFRFSNGKVDGQTVTLDDATTQQDWWDKVEDRSGYVDFIGQSKMAYSYDPEPRSGELARVMEAGTRAGFDTEVLALRLIEKVVAADAEESGTGASTASDAYASAAAAGASSADLDNAASTAILLSATKGDDASARLKAERATSIKLGAQVKAEQAKLANLNSRFVAEHAKVARLEGDVRDEQNMRHRVKALLDIEQAKSANLEAQVAAADTTQLVQVLRDQVETLQAENAQLKRMPPPPREEPHVHPLPLPTAARGDRDLAPKELDTLYAQIKRLDKLDRQNALDQDGKAHLQRLSRQWEDDQGAPPQLGPRPAGSPPQPRRATFSNVRRD